MALTLYPQSCLIFSTRNPKFSYILINYQGASYLSKREYSIILATPCTFKLKVLFLLVAHPELNPIEMVWGVIKRKVAERNVNFNLTEVESIRRSEVATITPELLLSFIGILWKKKKSIEMLMILMVRQTYRSISKVSVIILTKRIPHLTTL